MMVILKCLLFAILWTTSVTQEQPDSQVMAEIYKNAPPLVKAALRNVGASSPNQRSEATRRQGALVGNPQVPYPSTIGRLKPLMRRLPLSLPSTPTISSRQSYDSREPYFVIQKTSQPSGVRKSSSRRLVLAIPKDVQILKAESLSVLNGNNRAKQTLPGSLTLSFRDAARKSNSNSNRNRIKWNMSRGYLPSNTKVQSSQTPISIYRGGKRQALRESKPELQFEFIPFPQDLEHPDEEDEGEGLHNQFRFHEEYRRPEDKPEVFYGDYEDLIGTSGGQITFVKSQKSPPKFVQAQKAMGQSFEPMKAIIIQPDNIKAKRVTVMQTESRKVTPMTATLLKATNVQPIKASYMKAMTHAANLKSASVTKAKHRYDRSQLMGSSNIQVVSSDPPPEPEEARFLGDSGLNPMEQDGEVPPIDLQCGGNNDLGWCDLGQHYPTSEVTQIMEVCEELVTRMYVETPSTPEVLEDTIAYVLFQNITDHFSKRRDRIWNSNDRPAPLQGTLCDVTRKSIRPSFAQDVKGKWHVVIQTEKFIQTVPLEVCRSPGDPCQNTEKCTSQSQCVQKYTYQHLISFDPESSETCPFMRLYKFPTACVCRFKTSSSLI